MLCCLCYIVPVKVKFQRLSYSVAEGDVQVEVCVVANFSSNSAPAISVTVMQSMDAMEARGEHFISTNTIYIYVC